VRGDLVGRAMRLIAEGIVDRDGVAGLARRLAVSERHLHRLLLSELGAGPLAIARAQRAQTARTLIETTDLPFIDVAFAAGFESVRQFNDSVREVFALTPTALRTSGRRRGDVVEGALTLRLPYRPPLDWPALFGWLRVRAVPGVAHTNGNSYRRTLRLPRGAAIVSLEPVNGHINCTLKLESMSDLTTAVRQCRRLLDLDADPLSVVEVLSKDRRLSSIVKKHPGLRAPGAVDGPELAIQAVLGQQVSLAAARTLAARLVTAHGDFIKIADPTLTHLFPGADIIAEADLSKLGVPATRRATLHALAAAIAGGTARARSRRGPRPRPSTSCSPSPALANGRRATIVMRALGDPDTFLAERPRHQESRRPPRARHQPAGDFRTRRRLAPLADVCDASAVATLTPTPKEAS